MSNRVYFKETTMDEKIKMVRVDMDTHKKIKVNAIAMDITMEEFIKQAVEEYIKNNG